jgi:hypothetical protein
MTEEGGQLAVDRGRSAGVLDIVGISFFSCFYFVFCVVVERINKLGNWSR